MEGVGLGGDKPIRRAWLCKISVLTVLRTGYRKGKGSCESRFYDVVDRLFSTEARSRRNLVTGPLLVLVLVRKMQVGAWAIPGHVNDRMIRLPR